jgi:hypothetical protein
VHTAYQCAAVLRYWLVELYGSHSTQWYLLCSVHSSENAPYSWCLLQLRL